jgi:hypothetical protein
MSDFVAIVRKHLDAEQKRIGKGCRNAVTETLNMLLVEIAMEQASQNVAPIVEAETAAERLPWAWPPSVPPGEQPKYPQPIVEADGNTLTYAGFRWQRILPTSTPNPSPESRMTPMEEGERYTGPHGKLLRVKRDNPSPEEPKGGDAT